MRAGSASGLGAALPLGSEKLQAMGTGGFGAHLLRESGPGSWRAGAAQRPAPLLRPEWPGSGGWVGGRASYSALPVSSPNPVCSQEEVGATQGSAEDKRGHMRSCEERL